MHVLIVLAKIDLNKVIFKAIQIKNCINKTIVNVHNVRYIENRKVKISWLQINSLTRI